MPLAALFIWPLIALAVVKYHGRTKGVVWAIMIGALILPEAYEFDLPGLPPFDKELSIIVGVILGLWASDALPQMPQAPHGEDLFAKRLIYGLASLLLLSSLLTVLNNTEVLVFGPVRIQGLGVRDLITMTSQCVVFLAPYFIAQRYLWDPDSHAMLLRAFVIAGLAYSLLILFEVRMSPQLHRWTYGYFQHGWEQHVRGGSFRPIVFQPHGLWIGILLMTCTMSAFILLRTRVSEMQPRLQYLLAGFWLCGVLLISRNLGASLLAFIFVPILWFLGPRLQVWISITVMAIFLIFPILRQSEVVTFESTLDLVGNISLERQQSLQFRVDNEALFLERAALKPLTGWGIWSRWRIRDSTTGEDVSTADGLWIIVLGERGWIGYIAYFGLLMAPTFLLLRAARRHSLPSSTAGLALIMAAIIVYQVPNDTVGPLTLIIAGALAGFVWRPQAASEKGAVTVPIPIAQKQKSAYTRFPVSKGKERPSQEII